MAGNKKSKRKSGGVKRSVQSQSPVLFRFNKNQELKLKLEPHQCLQAFADGVPTTDNWNTLTFRINTGLALAETFFNEEAKDMLTRSVAILIGLQQRFSQEGRWSATEEEIHTLGAALTLTDQIQDQTTRKEQLTVYLKVEKQLTTLPK